MSIIKNGKTYGVETKIINGGGGSNIVMLDWENCTIEDVLKASPLDVYAVLKPQGNYEICFPQCYKSLPSQEEIEGGGWYQWMIVFFGWDYRTNTMVRRLLAVWHNEDGSIELHKEE